MPWLVRESLADAAGLASFTHCPREAATLRVADAAYARSELALRKEQIGSDAPVRFEVAPGLVLSGLVQLPDGTPASRVLVTLRDPSGPEIGIRVEECDELGRFRFTGLPDRHFTLRASREARGETLSAELAGARPGEAPWQLVLKSEDVPSPQKR
jgi:hypothetical protein